MTGIEEYFRRKKTFASRKNNPQKINCSTPKRTNYFSILLYHCFALHLIIACIVSINVIV